MFKGILRSLGLIRENTPQVRVLGIYEVKGKPYSLIELLVKSSSGAFDTDKFTQEWPTVSRSKWPKAHLFKILNRDGTAIIADVNPGEFIESSIWVGNLRVCFFFHFPAYDLPLLTPWGSCRLPPKTPRPKRLSMVRYQQPELI